MALLALFASFRFRSQLEKSRFGNTAGFLAQGQGQEGYEVISDPNEAYEIGPAEPGPQGPPYDRWTVKQHGIPVRHFAAKETAERYATDPKYRASRVTVKPWEKATVRHCCPYLE